MSRFVLLSFVFLGWGFYELSGGSDFEPKPGVQPQTTVKATPDAPKSPAPTTQLAAAPSPKPAPAPAPVPTVRRNLSELVSTPQPTTTVTPAALSAGSVLTQPDALAQPSAQAALPQAILPPPPPEPPKDIRAVRGSRVNMRSGPGTAYSVLAKLKQGDQVIVLREPGNGWAKLKVVETGRIGWMSARLLTKIEVAE